MRILFFTLIKMTSMDDTGIYADMVKEFLNRGHYVDYYFPLSENYTFAGKNYSLNSIFIKNKIQKTNNFILKFLSYNFIDYMFSKIIKDFNQNYDLLIIATPSIFQNRIIKTFKNKYNNSKVLLLLKDIFPDNALDLKILNKKFPKILIYKYFKFIEKKLYEKVHKIGVMSELNKEYIEKRYPFLKEKLFISPNSKNFYTIKKNKSRDDLFLPKNKKILVFTGNIGLPQDPILFSQIVSKISGDFIFLIIGSGAKESKFKSISNEKLIYINENLTQKTIDQYLINSDYGFVILSKDFKVPNFPSKILTYINANLPIVAITNDYNDLKYLINSQIISGKWILNNKEKSVSHFIDEIISIDSIKQIKQNKLFNVNSQITSIIRELGL